MSLTAFLRSARLKLLTPFLVMIGLALSAALAWQAAQSAAAIDQQRFTRLNESVQAEITRRMHLFEYGLNRIQSVWSASHAVERGEFAAAVMVHDPEQEFPGALGLGFIRRVERADLPGFLAATRADEAPGFKVKTSGDAADLFIIEYIEPLAKNTYAQGYDVGQERRRRAAAEYAMLTGKAAITEPIHLILNKNEGPGFLFFAPIYKNGTSPSTPEERRACLQGWAYMPIVAARIFSGVSSQLGDEIEFNIFTGSTATDRQNLFDSTVRSDTAGAPAAASKASRLPNQGVTRLSLGGQTWSLVVRPTATFMRASRAGLWSAMVGGPVLTLLLAGLILNLGRTTRKAVSLATAMTADLSSAKRQAEMLALVATRTTNAVIITDERRRITWVNEGFTRMTEFTAAEALGQSPGQLLQTRAADPATPIALRDALNRGEGFHAELLNRTKTGRDYWIEIDISPIQDETGRITGFIGVNIDITERKHAADLLKQQAERTELALAGGGLGLWDWNIATGETRFDERFASILGETAAELSPNVDTWANRVHPADRPLVRAAHERHFSGETPLYQCRHRVRHRRGHWLWIMGSGKVVSRSADGKPLRMVGTHQDITATQLAQLELERQTNALNHTSRLARIGAWELNLQQNTLTWSEQVYTLHAVDHGYVPTQTSSLDFYPGEAAITLQLLMQAAIDQGTPFDVELPFVSAIGERLWVRTVGEAQRVGDTTVLVRGALQDVTESHRQRETLARAKDDAEAATRTKAEFLANMSHEIRTPMNAVIGMTELLQGSALSPEQAEFVGTIRTSGDALLMLINDILDFSKIESGHLELEQAPFNLRDCLESAAAISGHSAAAKGLDLMIEIESGTPEAILGDVNRLRQITTNLLSNAVKFTSQGEVLIAVSLHPGNRLRCTVRDTGMGIPADKLDRLFKSFSQVDSSITRNFGGTGLGLAISQRLIGLMGGRIWVESTPGQGSVFSFEIPYLPVACPPSPEPGELSSLVGRRLLIVDDNATNRRILARQTDSWGLDAQTASSGPDALQLIDNGACFDAALIDVKMPGMDGLTLAAELRRRLPAQQLPILALSSLGSGAAAFVGLGVTQVITKPARATALQAALVGLFQPKPAAAPEDASLAPPNALDAPVQTQKLLILLVEDIEINQQMAALLLARLGYSAEIANNGVEALEAVARTTFDIIFLDMQMPEMDGLTCAAHLCAKYPVATRPWITAMTANALPGDREKCLAAGMDDYISKPISGQALSGAISRALTGLAPRRAALDPAA
jgi:PAS domain S-box-containing protein